MISRPRARIATRSAVCWISDRMWLETKTVRPSAPSWRSSSRTSTIPAGSRPFAGSSRISRAGSFMQGRRDPESLLHPERVGLHQVVRTVGEPDPLEHAVDRRPADPVEPGEDLEVPAAGEAREQRGRLDDRPDRRVRRWAARRASPCPSCRASPRSVRPDRGGTGSSWSCPPRSAPGNRRRRPRAPPGRAHRPPRCGRPGDAGTPCGARGSRSRRPCGTIPRRPIAASVDRAHLPEGQDDPPGREPLSS